MPIYTIQTPSGHKLRIEAGDEVSALFGAQQWHDENVVNARPADELLNEGGTPLAPQPGGAATTGAQQNAAPEKSSAIGDIAKGAGVGLVKGATALLGAPGDISRAIDRGTSWLAAKTAQGLGLTNKSTEDFMRSAASVGIPPSRISPPGAADIDKVVQAATGKYYEPQTGAGRVAERVASFVPSAAVTGGGLVGGVLAPAAGSELAGALTSGTRAEPIARTVGALAGNVGAAALPALFQNAPERIVRGATKGLDPAVFDDAQALQQKAATLGVPLSGPEAITAATKGASKLGDVQRIVEGTTGGGAKTSQFYAQRPSQVAAAVSRELDAIAPQPTDPYALGPRMSEAAQGSLDDVRQNINAAARPFYQAAERQTIPTADFEPIARDPAFQAGLRALRSDEVLGPTFAQQPDNSIGVVDAVTKHLRSRGEALGNKINPGYDAQKSGMFGSTAAEARDIARTPARGGSADYDLALRMQEQARRQNLEPLERGPLGRLAGASDTAQAADAILPRTPQAGGEGQLIDTIKRLVAAEPEGAPALVRQRLANAFDDAAGRLQSGENQWAGAKFANDIAGTPQLEANLSGVLEALGPVGPLGPVQPGARAASMRDLVDVLRATGVRRPQGSPTETNRLLSNELSSPGVLPELLASAKAGFLTAPLSIRDAFRRAHISRNAGKLADLFLSPDSVERIRDITTQSAAAPIAGALLRTALEPRR